LLKIIAFFAVAKSLHFRLFLAVQFEGNPGTLLSSRMSISTRCTRTMKRLLINQENSPWHSKISRIHRSRETSPANPTRCRINPVKDHNRAAAGSRISPRIRNKYPTSIISTTESLLIRAGFLPFSLTARVIFRERD
jgi:hypothetical protein